MQTNDKLTDPKDKENEKCLAESSGNKPHHGALEGWEKDIKHQLGGFSSDMDEKCLAESSGNKRHHEDPEKDMDLDLLCDVSLKDKKMLYKLYEDICKPQQRVTHTNKENGANIPVRRPYGDKGVRCTNCLKLFYDKPAMDEHLNLGC
ncbi:uncharacterized protein [Antedon mediterranea]